MKRYVVPRLFALVLAASLAFQPAVFALGSNGQPSLGNITLRSDTKAAFTRVLKLGCKGQDVLDLQKKLKELGFFKSSTTTLFGSITFNAVKAFQKARKLTCDGVVGRVTFSAIYNTVKPSSITPTPTPAAINDPGKYGRLQNQTALKRGATGLDVYDLQRALKQKGFFSGTLTGNYESLTQAAVIKFQRSVGLDGDGIAGNYTLSALYTMLSSYDLSKITPWPAQASEWAALPVEKQQWSDASVNVFKKGLSAVVVDVKTGYAFNIKRTGGSLHADVETVAPQDTATFYKAVGNFSWARRPIWVIVDGHRLAASMNCMPHGYDSISNNDFRGQFCIHFVGSRTHGSNRVDPDHQAAIEVAYKTVMVVPGATPPPTSAPPSATQTPTATASVKRTATAAPTATPKPTATPDITDDDGGAQQMPPP